MACNGQKNAANESNNEGTVAQKLFNRLDSLRGQGYMFGHQDDPFYGLTWAY